MLHHVSVGVRDVERAARFYDSILAKLGYKRVMEVLPYAIAYGERMPEFWVGLPADQSPATIGNGVHIGFKAKSKEAIQAFHRAAIDAGGTDEGGPGPRPDYGPDYYGAFVRDLDGNKVEAVLAPEAVPVKKAAASRGAKRKAAKLKARPRHKKGKAAKRKTTRRKKRAK
jgi:catechol 2,3-dioxygenase-like lactoylglutathione lyase family enzyme